MRVTILSSTGSGEDQPGHADMHCRGLHEGPPKRSTRVLTLGTWECDLSGKRVFADAVKDPERRSPWATERAPKSNGMGTYTRHPRDRHREVGLVKTQADTGVLWPKAKERLGPPEAGRSKEGFSPRVCRGGPAPPKPSFQTSGLQNREGVTL